MTLPALPVAGFSLTSSVWCRCSSCKITVHFICLLFLLLYPMSSRNQDYPLVGPQHITVFFKGLSTVSQWYVDAPHPAAGGQNQPGGQEPIFHTMTPHTSWERPRLVWYLAIRLEAAQVALRSYLASRASQQIKYGPTHWIIASR
jgi:hypothetical protein